MNPVTQAQIKKLTGLSKQFISKECKAERLTMCESNNKRMVDLDGHLTVEWLRQRSDKITKKVVPETPIDKDKIIDLINKPQQSSGNNPSGLSTADPDEKKLKDVKLEEQIEQLRIKNQQSRGDLIEKFQVKKLFGKMYEIDQNEFKTINVSITPKISAVYNTANTTKTKDIIELITAETDIKASKIKNLKSEINKTLEAGEPDRILEMNKILEDATGKILENIQREIDGFINMIEEKGE